MNKFVSMIRSALLVVAVVAITGCATNGQHVKSEVGDTSKLANVVHKGEIFVTKTDDIEVPVAFTRVNQLAFLDPKTNEILYLPDGKGGKLGIIRGWSFDTAEKFASRFLPGFLNTLTGGILQGEYNLKGLREANRLCKESEGGCNKSGAPMAISISGAEANALLDGISMQLISGALQGGCTDGCKQKPAVPDPATSK